MEKSWRQYQKLRMKKYRSEWKLFLVEGIRICREALLSDFEIEAVFINESFTENPVYHEFQEYFKSHQIGPKVLSNSNFKKLADTENPQGVLLVLKMPEHIPETEPRLKNIKYILILDEMRDPGNTGTIIRTADWFGVQLVVASPDSVDFFNPKVVRASMGSIFRIPLLATDDLRKFLNMIRKNNFYIVCSSLKSKATIGSLQIRPPLALIIGSEASGISPALQKSAHSTVRIPKFGESESLNAAVAAGIIMNHFSNVIYSDPKK